MTLNCDISRTSWHVKVSDGSFFWIFHALSLERKKDKNSISQCIGQSHIITAFSNMAKFRSRTSVRQTCARCAVKTIKL